MSSSSKATHPPFEAAEPAPLVAESGEAFAAALLETARTVRRSPRYVATGYDSAFRKPVAEEGSEVDAFAPDAGGNPGGAIPRRPRHSPSARLRAVGCHAGAASSAAQAPRGDKRCR